MPLESESLEELAKLFRRIADIFQGEADDSVVKRSPPRPKTAIAVAFPDMPERMLKALHRQGVYSLEELLLHSEQQVGNLPNVGKTSMKWFAGALKKQKLQMADYRQAKPLFDWERERAQG